ncbi:hypothetical protein RSAG8_12477, partial [Rhizoctonia solani AG-8 WAC10335]
MTIIHSEGVLLEDIFVSSRSKNGNPARNTDGADTIASNRITFRGWEVENGDDSIALKANSTNILMGNMVLRDGQGIAMGSIGQYNGIYEYIEKVIARNITCIGTRYASRIKTWAGIQQGYPLTAAEVEPVWSATSVGHPNVLVWDIIVRLILIIILLNSLEGLPTHRRVPTSF